jgi:hypothetical protein
MDRTVIEANLAQAEAHVALGEKHISRQREIIAEMERDGHDAVAANARDLLRLFVELQAEHVAHRDRLRNELAESSG